MKKPVYVGVFFEPHEMQKLRGWWEHEVGSDLLGEVPKNPHVTAKFKPSLQEVLAMPLGRKLDVRVLGWAEDDKCQAVIVDAPSEKPNTHITLATSPGTPPVYANSLLTSGFNRALGPTLEGVVGYYDGDVKFKPD